MWPGVSAPVDGRVGTVARVSTIVVVGSINVDDVYEASSLPVAGETVTGAVYQQTGGGKGANQAVAAAYQGQPVRLIAMVGPDPDGRKQLADLEALGVDCSTVGSGEQPTGRAAVLIGGGENQIVVASGANHELSPGRVRAAMEGVEEGIMLISAEIPDAAIGAAAQLGRAAGMQIVVNAAPARPLPTEVTDGSFLLVVNEIEAEVVSSSLQVTTLGSAGVVVDQPGESSLSIPAIAVDNVVDTTGAGDAFCGVLAASLARGATLIEAAQTANEVAARVIQVVGARTWRYTELS